MMEQQKKEVKKLTLGFILGWVLGVLAAISGVTLLFQQLLVGVLMLLLAIVLLPPANQLIADKFKFSISGGLRLVIAILLLGVIGATMSFDSKKEALDVLEEMTQQPPATPQGSAGEDVQKSYQKVFTFSGNGAKKSEPFAIQGNRFKIAYDCGGDPDFTLCQAFVYKVGSSLPQVVMNSTEAIKDETVIYRGRGEYYIDMNAIGSYTMTVYDYR